MFQKFFNLRKIYLNNLSVYHSIQNTLYCLTKGRQQISHATLHIEIHNYKHIHIISIINFTKTNNVKTVITYDH